VGTALCGSELRKKGAAVEAVGWSNRVCWRKTVLLHGEGPSLVSGWKRKKPKAEEKIGLCFWRRRRWRGKKREAAVLMVFLHCWCSADDRLGRLVVFGRKGAGKRCRFEGRRRCWNRLEREKENEGLCREGSPAGRGKPKTWGAALLKKDGFRVRFFCIFFS
jgi:hypothetical protein